ncbi:hypothetical protein ACO2Q8_28475 [Larkinella sp. VNQ87]|uniref:hypothetical protein n=1 Tax=Larkinella sp. VNQ87 TaxID=3400921 RepID=UPI003C0080EA
MTISIISTGEQLFHDDLYVNFPELDIEQYNDTYYFALDSGILPEEEDERKVKIVLNDLLTNWEKSVEALSNESTALLPIDFSDQYVGALKVRRKDDHLTVHYSTYRMDGGMFPSFMNKISFDEEIFTSKKSFTISVKDFLAEIMRERDKIEV